MTDFLDEKRQEIVDRLAELKPLVDEFHRLEAAAAALVGVGNSSTSTSTTTTRRRPGRPPGRPRRTTAAAPAAAAASSAAKPAAKRRGRPPGSGRKRAATSTASSTAAATTTRRRPGRRKGSGTRSVQALSLVQGQPGISIPELAARMGIKQNYLYRVLPSLEQEGKVRKQGRGWHPKG